MGATKLNLYIALKASKKPTLRLIVRLFNVPYWTKCTVPNPIFHISAKLHWRIHPALLAILLCVWNDFPEKGIQLKMLHMYCIYSYCVISITNNIWICFVKIDSKRIMGILQSCILLNFKCINICPFLFPEWPEHRQMNPFLPFPLLFSCKKHFSYKQNSRAPYAVFVTKDHFI